MIRHSAAAFVVLGLAATPAGAAEHDAFYWLGQFNKASLVMTVEQGIVPQRLAGPIAEAVKGVIEAGDAPGGKRPADYLQLEPLLIARAGPDVTRMHSGRSRQDILATTRREMMRERALALADALDGVRADLLEQAERHRDAIVPAYTNGVQAQPTTFGHIMLAFDAVLARDTERVRQAWVRLDLSPLGSAALGTSSFPVDRARLAQLLGFADVADNSYDANQLAPFDTEAELAMIASLVATTAGQFAQDIHTQYAQPHPWLMLQEGRLTGPSGANLTLGALVERPR
ncbi:MAG: lyase family protein [Acetobacteraceae bacterium]|nr:lyase family protein [Acetobacteraceae bacterium]